jgi:hypothetical protein
MNDQVTIISFFGPMGAGKDKCVEVADKVLRRYGVSAFHLAFASELKQIVLDKYGAFIDQAEDPAERKRRFRVLCQYEGEMSCKIYDRVWIDMLDKSLSYYSHPAYQERRVILISDMRKPKEYEYLQGKGAVMVRVDTPIEKRLRRIQQRDGYTPGPNVIGHQTEQYFDHFEAHELIDNKGTLEKLEKQVEDIIYHYVFGGGAALVAAAN